MKNLYIEYPSLLRQWRQEAEHSVKILDLTIKKSSPQLVPGLGLVQGLAKGPGIAAGTRDQSGDRGLLRGPETAPGTVDRLGDRGPPWGLP